MEDASAKAHHERMARGVVAMQNYLQAQFPSYVVETLQPSSHDVERSARTFVVRKDRERRLLRVSHEVLDLDTDGVRGLLQRFGVARALRQVNAGEFLLVTTDGTRVEPI